jgi:hypothetical protein
MRTIYATPYLAFIFQPDLSALNNTRRYAARLLELGFFCGVTQGQRRLADGIFDGIHTISRI